MSVRRATRDSQGDLSFENYDDSLHSKGSVAGGGAGGIKNISMGADLSGLPSSLMRGPSIKSDAPWGSGMGGGGKNDPVGGQLNVVHGGIWLPTPRTQSASTFSPSGDVIGGTDGAGGGAGVSGGAAQGAGRGVDSSGRNAARGGFFRSDEVSRCARCSNTDADAPAQVRIKSKGNRCVSLDTVRWDELG